ncbi:MAG TPA: hypothetical protein DCE42_05145 [Myxococcales bacterium]|nr:hypothetical protein [Deltaproteobacteria bacterium]MBU54173.1 hypothetical protein [Deltaproteobacteria bacterium]HAA54117.1 hypothetical protein [Myxococcales bacterium]|tara:strand:+ start:5716 stop:6453 length:738 start_codon:yes stop_codon:yes gene_type:complete
MTQSERVTVIICCLNEEKNIEKTVDDIYEVVPGLDIEVNVLMINDGSTDNTEQAMIRLGEKYEGCRHISLEKNIGLGAATMLAHENIDDESWVTIVPGDNEFDFKSIQSFLELKDQYDVLLGYYGNAVIRPLGRRIASSTFNTVTNFLYSYDCRYLNGMKMYKAKTFKGLQTESTGHAFFAELLAKAIIREPSLRIGEVPFWVRGRKYGKSTAIQPLAILKAVKDTLYGYISVAEYREQTFRGKE